MGKPVRGRNTDNRVYCPYEKQGFTGVNLIALWVLPHFRCSSRPGGSGQGLEVPRLCRFIRRPDHELAAGEEPAPNFLHFQPDHGSRTVPAAPKVRENRPPILRAPKHSLRVLLHGTDRSGEAGGSPAGPRGASVCE